MIGSLSFHSQEEKTAPGSISNSNFLHDKSGAKVSRRFSIVRRFSPYTRMHHREGYSIDGHPSFNDRIQNHRRVLCKTNLRSNALSIRHCLPLKTATAAPLLACDIRVANLHELVEGLYISAEE